MSIQRAMAGTPHPVVPTSPRSLGIDAWRVQDADITDVPFHVDREGFKRPVGVTSLRKLNIIGFHTGRINENVSTTLPCESRHTMRRLPETFEFGQIALRDWHPNPV